VRAVQIVQQNIRRHAEFLHAKRWSALWRVVEALVVSRRLWLTGLGRAVAGPESDRHRVKVVDRLVGSAAIQRALPELYGALALTLLRGIARPCILVDWTGGGSKFYILSAKLCFKGRAISIFSKTFPVELKCTPRAQREFLDLLRRVLPPHCTPVLVTDAGFLMNWFDDVRRLGWHYVGRVRGSLHVVCNEEYIPLTDLHLMATRKPKDLGLRVVGKSHPREARLVLSSKKKLKGRVNITTLGTPRQRTADHQRSKAEREPWLLATSLDDRARSVVDIYSTRMQIEQTFRDLKNHRFGWSLADARCRTPARVDVLLLLAALAALVVHAVGIAAAARKMQRRFQINTEKIRAVFSTLFLGGLMIERGLDATLDSRDLRKAFQDLQRTLGVASGV